jgi:hypothetical protein
MPGDGGPRRDGRPHGRPGAVPETATLRGGRGTRLGVLWWHHTGAVPRRRAEVRRSLRRSQELDDGIKEVAAAESRSVNGQTEHFLREGVARWRRRREQEGEARRGADR